MIDHKKLERIRADARENLREAKAYPDLKSAILIGPSKDILWLCRQIDWNVPKKKLNRKKSKKVWKWIAYGYCGRCGKLGSCRHLQTK